MQQSNYRIYLGLLFRILIFVGIIFTITPFVSSFINVKPGLERTAANLIFYDDISLAELKPGMIKKITFEYIPIWIYKLRESEQLQLPKLDKILFNPKQSKIETGNDPRLLHYFVFKPLESIRSCNIRYLQHSTKMSARVKSLQLTWLGGFTESCFASVYDLQGRRYKNTGKPQQLNLSVPRYLIYQNNMQQDIIQFYKPLLFQASH